MAARIDRMVACTGRKYSHQAIGLWRQFDTVLLDMDGTLARPVLRQLVLARSRAPLPGALARHRPPDETREQLFEHFARKQGSLDWYCLDYWTAELGLDLRALKAASSHRIRYLPGAREFLRAGPRLGQAARARDQRPRRYARGEEGRLRAGAVLRGLRHLPRVRRAEGIGAISGRSCATAWASTAQRTLFVDDSLPVLDAASAFRHGRRRGDHAARHAPAGAQRRAGIMPLKASWSCSG